MQLSEAMQESIERKRSGLKVRECARVEKNYKAEEEDEKK